MTVNRKAFDNVRDLLRNLGNSIGFSGKVLADVNQRDLFGNTPLGVVVAQGPSEEIALQEAKLLIEAGANVNLGGEDNETPLHVAASWGRSQIVKALIESGAVSGVRNNYGQTASDVASLAGFEELAKYLRALEIS